eukprot:COSAG01_NODE_40427_length_463_cov_10.266484_1_plen_73_part_00
MNWARTSAARQRRRRTLMRYPPLPPPSISSNGHTSNCLRPESGLQEMVRVEVYWEFLASTLGNIALKFGENN